MKLPKWLPKLPWGQFGTWAGHAALTIAAPALIGIIAPFSDTLLTVAIASIPVLAFYIAREQGDERSHKARGDWTEHMGSSDVTPEIDQWGDLLGPAAVTSTFWVAWLLTL